MEHGVERRDDQREAPLEAHPAHIAGYDSYTLSDFFRRLRQARFECGEHRLRPFHAGHRNAGARKPPLFVKIAPDQPESGFEDIAEVAMQTGIDGIIIGNTTVTRPASIPPEIAKEAGGLSGKPLFTMSTSALARMYKLTQGRIPLIGCGGRAI